jgi:hypothetical protein
MIEIGDKVVLANNNKRQLTVIQLLGGDPDPWAICVEDPDLQKKQKAFNYRCTELQKITG